MTKPSNNITPGGKTDEDTDEEPQLEVLPDRWPLNEEEIFRLKQQLTTERQKNARYRTQVTNLKNKLATSEATREATEADLKRKCDTANANRRSQCKKLKADISVLELKETSALSVATTSSKIVDGATKGVIREKSTFIRKLQKEVAEQLVAIEKGKVVKENLALLKVKAQDLKEHNTELEKEIKKISKNNDSLSKKIDDQVGAKYAHQLRMAEIKLEAKQVGLDSTKHRQGMAIERNKSLHEGKRDLINLTFEMRGRAKEADLTRKEENLKKKTKQHADRIQVVSSEMLRTNRLNGGSFPNPGLSFQEVSAAPERVWFPVVLSCLLYSFNLF